MLKTHGFLTRPMIWKATKPFRIFNGKAKSLWQSNQENNLIIKALKSIKHNGLLYALNEIKFKIIYAGSASLIADQPLFSSEELEAQKNARFRKDIKYSILVSLPFLQSAYFQEMLQSVLQQTYANWELWLLIGNDAIFDEAEMIVRSSSGDLSRVHFSANGTGPDGSPEIPILNMSSGEYVVFLRQNELLHPAALHEITRAICEKDADFIYTDENSFRFIPEDANNPWFKPSFAPDSLRGHNYIGHFITVQKTVLEESYSSDFTGSTPVSHDMVLRLTEKAQHIIHIPEILYYTRAEVVSAGENVPASEYEATDVAAVERHLQRVGLVGEVSPVKPDLPFYHVKYALKASPKVSVLIPSYEHLADLKLCLSSIFSKTTYPNYEVIIVENNSRSPEVFEFYERIQNERDNVLVAVWENEFNYSAINNFGVGFCSGEYILLLNNDTEVITPDWIQEMLMFGQREDVGAVGAKLLFPDGTVQHGGVAFGIGGVANHLNKNIKRDDPGYMGQLLYAQNLSAVTAACMLIRREVWDQVNGLDERFAVAFNDTDLCMRIRQKGYLIVWTPFAELFHFESKSRGYENTPEKKERFSSEIFRFRERWSKELAAGDPYYNPNFSLDRESFTVRPILRQNNSR